MTIARKARRVALQTARGFFGDRGPDLAASLTFSTLLMAVPLAATFAILLATFFRENDLAILDAVNMALPYQSARITANLREFIESAKTVSGVGIAVLVATSLRLIFIIEDTVNHVWGAPKRRRLLARMVVYTVGLFAGALLLGVLVSGLDQLRKQIAFENIVASALFGRLLAALVVAAALTLLYRFLPNARVSWSSAALAAVIVSLSLRIIKFGFALYFKLFHTINIIYGSLSLVLLLLLSLFFFWELVLAGVELTFVLDAGDDASTVRAGEGRAESAVRLLIALAAHAAPVRLEDLKQDLGRSDLESIARQLAQDDLVAEAEGQGWGIVRKLESVPLAKVVASVSPELFSVAPDGHDRIARILRRLFRKQTAEQQNLLSITLAELSSRK
ncbi:MAG: YihY family inner membrane protein [Thermoanaerobaculia bacterium]